MMWLKIILTGRNKIFNDLSLLTGLINKRARVKSIIVYKIWSHQFKFLIYFFLLLDLLLFKFFNSFDKTKRIAIYCVAFSFTCTCHLFMQSTVKPTRITCVSVHSAYTTNIWLHLQYLFACFHQMTRYYVFISCTRTLCFKMQLITLISLIYDACVYCCFCCLFVCTIKNISAFCVF